MLSIFGCYEFCLNAHDQPRPLNLWYKLYFLASLHVEAFGVVFGWWASSEILSRNLAKINVKCISTLKSYTWFTFPIWFFHNNGDLKITRSFITFKASTFSAWHLLAVVTSWRGIDTLRYTCNVIVLSSSSRSVEQIENKRTFVFSRFIRGSRVEMYSVWCLQGACTMHSVYVRLWWNHELKNLIKTT